MNDKKYDAIVIGAGIIGNCISYELSQKGYKCLSVDKLGGSGFGSTSGSCAIIRFHYSTREGITLSREGYHYWLNWTRYLKTIDPAGMAYYKNTGDLVLKTEINKGLKPVMPIFEELGISYLDLNNEQMKPYMPNPNFKSYSPQKNLDDPDFGKPTHGEINGGVFFTETGYVSDPKLSTHNVEMAARTFGADFMFNAEVTEVLQKNGRVSGIKLASGEIINAPIIINVSGPHSYLINQMAGVEDKMNIKTKALRVEVAHVPSPEGVDYEKFGTMISDGNTGIYTRPEVGNHWLIGSEEPECDPLEYVDPDNYELNLTDQAKKQAMRLAMRFSDIPIPNKIKGIVDLYDVSDDWYPIYDKSDLPGFYMAVGTSGNQYKNAPVVGAFMSELINYCEKGNDHDKKPLQYQMPYIKKSFDIGFFSRNRNINKDSSFSVVG